MSDFFEEGGVARRAGKRSMSLPDVLAAAPPAVERAPIYRAGLGRSVPRGFVRIGAAIAIPDVLREFNARPEDVCARAGVPSALFDHPDNTLPMTALGRLAACGEEATRRNDFGLMVAERATASNLGLVGFLIKQAPNVGAALKDLTRYLHHTDRAAVPLLEVKGGLVMVGYSVIEPNVPALDLIYDGAIGIYYNILRGLCGPEWNARDVAISRRRPAAATRYERFFGAPVAFDAEATTIVFDARWLDAPLPHADAALRSTLREQIELIETEEAGHFSEQVRRLLRTAFLTSAISIEEMACALHVTKRTLMRRLGEEGTSFRQLSAEIQFEIARQLMEHTSMSLTQIALALKYSEASAFSRAFHQWSGMSPSDWRGRRERRPKTPAA